MKKGIQYSHYCGTELQDIMDSVWLCIDLADTDNEKSKEWGKHALKRVKDLRDKIAELDKINEMKY